MSSTAYNFMNAANNVINSLEVLRQSLVDQESEEEAYFNKLKLRLMVQSYERVIAHITAVRDKHVSEEASSLMSDLDFDVENIELEKEEEENGD